MNTSFMRRAIGLSVAVAAFGTCLSDEVRGQNPPAGRSFLPDAQSFVQRFLAGDQGRDVSPGFAMCPHEHPWNEAVFRGIIAANPTGAQRGRAALDWAPHTGRCADPRLDSFIVDFLDRVRISGRGDEVYGAVMSLEGNHGVSLSPPVEAALRRIVFDPSIDGRPSLFEHVAEARSRAASVLLEHIGEDRLQDLLVELYDHGAPPHRFWDGNVHFMAGRSVQERRFLLRLVTERAPSGADGRVTAGVIAALATGLRTNPPSPTSGFREEFRAAMERAANAAGPDRVRAAAAQALRALDGGG